MKQKDKIKAKRGKCFHCDGTGERQSVVKSSNGMIRLGNSKTVVCYWCNGTGSDKINKITIDNET